MRRYTQGNVLTPRTMTNDFQSKANCTNLLIGEDSNHDKCSALNIHFSSGIVHGIFNDPKLVRKNTKWVLEPSTRRALLRGHSVHNNTEHFLWSQVGKWAIMGQKLIYYHIGTPTYMLNDVSKHPRPLKIMLNHIFKNQCHKPRNKKNTFLVSKVG